MTQHDFLPSLLGDGDKGIEKVYVEDQMRQAIKTEQNLMYRHDDINEPTKEGSLFHFSSMSPHSPQFQKSAGATPL